MLICTDIDFKYCWISKPCKEFAWTLYFLTWTVSLRKKNWEEVKCKKSGETEGMMKPIYLNLDYTTRNHAHTNDMFCRYLYHIFIWYQCTILTFWQRTILLLHPLGIWVLKSRLYFNFWLKFQKSFICFGRVLLAIHLS